MNGTQNAAFSDFAVRALRLYAGAIFCAGFSVVSTHYFQAAGQPFKATILSMVRQLFILIPLMIILPQFMGVDGILIAVSVADLGAAAVIAPFIALEIRKLNKRIKKGERPVFTYAQHA